MKITMNRPLLKVWDNGGKSFDGYTVQIGADFWGMSENPGSPQGFFKYIGSGDSIDIKGCGRLVNAGTFKELPGPVQVAILELFRILTPIE
jgi:hypothetical protein